MAFGFCAIKQNPPRIHSRGICHFTCYNMSITQKLVKVQTELKSPKNQRNSFGNYNYRSCEDILEAVKPLLSEQGLLLTISDDIVEVGGRVYIKATATVSDGENSQSVSAFAREIEDKLNKEGKPSMDQAQITGSTSSYARKYALNGLFCIDDTKDADSNEQRTQTESPKAQAQYASEPQKPWINKKDIEDPKFEEALKQNKKSGKTAQEVVRAIRQKWAVNKAYAGMIEDIYKVIAI